MEPKIRRITDKSGDYAEITGGSGIGRVLRIPDEVDGLPVRSVCGHAFERNQVIEEVILPDTLLQVGGFAFYGCGKLRKISLSDHTEGWGNGVLRLCDSLSHVEFRVHRGRYAVLRDLLAGVDCRLYVKIVENGEETELYFPAYVRGFDEDTFARAIHSWIEGAGYAYREAVERKGVNMRTYDSLFERARSAGTESGARVALSRLMYPKALRMEMKTEYECYLRQNAEEVIRLLLDERSMEARKRVFFLAGNGLLTAEAADAGALISSGMRDSEMTALLMSCGTRGRTAYEESDGDFFDPGDL